MKCVYGTKPCARHRTLDQFAPDNATSRLRHNIDPWTISPQQSILKIHRLGKESPTPVLAQIIRSRPVGRLLPTGITPSIFKRHASRSVPRVSVSISHRLFSPAATQNITTSTTRPSKAADYATSSLLPSPQSILLHTLQHAKHDKWGFVIYRCTYHSEADWARFKSILGICASHGRSLRRSIPGFVGFRSCTRQKPIEHTPEVLCLP